MPNRSRRRAGSHRRRGRAQAGTLAARLGVTVKTARLAHGLTQAQIGARAGISQTAVSKIEHGRGTSFSLETWASLSAGLGLERTCFLRGASAADLPRDHEHLRRQQLVLDAARRGGWVGRIEVAVRAIDCRALSIDVLLVRERRREMVVAEVWDWLADVGEAFRGHATKTAAVEASNPNWMVGGLFVLRGTRRNRELVHELRDLFAARFPIPSAAVLRALADADRPLPAGSALVWTDAAATRLLLSRLS